MLRRGAHAANRLRSIVWQQHAPWVLPAYSAPAAAAVVPVGVQKLGVAIKYIAGAGAALWATQQEDLSERVSLAWLIGLRLARDVYTAASIVAGKPARAVISRCGCAIALRSLIRPLRRRHMRAPQAPPALPSAASADYKVTMRELEPSEREAAMEACHQRSSDKLLELCFRNGGIYTKLGQHIGQLVGAPPDRRGRGRC
jgi:hypothetical protein